MQTESPSSASPFQNHRVVFTGKLASTPRKAAQQLVQRLGGETLDRLTRRTTLLVVGDEGFMQHIVRSSKLQQAEQLNAKGAAIEIISEQAFLQMAGQESREMLEQKYYSLERIQSVFPRIRAELVRMLERYGLLRPAVRTNATHYFEFKDLLRFRKINAWLQQGVSLRRIMAELTGTGAPPGQLSLDFAPPGGRGIVLKHPRAVVHEKSAQEWFDIGCQVDADPQAFDKAVNAYRQALALAPDYTEAMINLAKLYHHHNDLVEAGHLLRDAQRLEPDNYLIQYNLGLVHDDLGELDAAQQHYEWALDLYAAHEPALFNLALLHEKRRHLGTARSLWQQYLHLDPESEWAEIAREHLQHLEQHVPAPHTDDSSS